jgi:hypothetical protein
VRSQQTAMNPDWSQAVEDAESCLTSDRMGEKSKISVNQTATENTSIVWLRIATP